MTVDRGEPMRESAGRASDVELVRIHDRVHWGSIIAGLLTTVTTLLLLGLLGTAVGLTVFDEGADGRVIGTSASIWGAATLLLAFFIGGWVAARTAGIAGDGDAVFNGLMVAIAGIVVLLWLVGTGLGYLFGAVTANLEVIADVGRDLAAGDVDAASAQTAFDDARNGTWGTLAGLVLALIAAGLGGWLGQHEPAVEEEPVTPRTRAKA